MTTEKHQQQQPTEVSGMVIWQQQDVLDLIATLTAQDATLHDNDRTSSSGSSSSSDRGFQYGGMQAAGCP
jgi:hypothetical protein